MVQSKEAVDKRNIMEHNTGVRTEEREDSEQMPRR